MDYLYLYVTDAETVEMPQDIPSHVHVIKRANHNDFYGKYRTGRLFECPTNLLELKHLRDVPQPAPIAELRKKEKKDKKDKKRKQEADICNVVISNIVRTVDVKNNARCLVVNVTSSTHLQAEVIVKKTVTQSILVNCFKRKKNRLRSPTKDQHQTH